MSSSADFLLEMNGPERDGLARRARAAGMTVEQYVRRQCGIDEDVQMTAFANAARRAGARFDSAFAELDAQLAARPRTHAIALAAGAEDEDDQHGGQAAAA
jgi:hypothetical protein